MPGETPTPPPPNSTLRNLGEFFGHILKGVRTDPTKPPAPIAAQTRTEEEVRDTPAGKVVLRRTIIEEIVLPPGESPPV